jgi:isopentenyl-diphosphate delta-isomerase
MNKSLALFDIDKTIYDGHVILPLVDFQHQAGLLTKESLDDMYRSFGLYTAGEVDYETTSFNILKAWAFGLKGVSHTEVVKHVLHYLEHEGNKFYPSTRELMQLLYKTHDIYFVTGEPQFIGEAIQKEFNAKGFVSSVFEVVEEVFSGEVVTTLAFRNDKETAIKELTIKYDAKHSFAFGDAEADIKMLSMVAHPVCVHPRPALKEVALEKGWTVADSNSIVDQVKLILDYTNAHHEVLDLVNEDDEIIGEVTKGEVNSNKDLLHREIAIILFDKDNRVLLQQRSFKKKIYPGVWTVSVAGHVLKGMEPLVAAHKELEEELGFDTELTFILKEIIKLPIKSFIEYWYLGKYNNEHIELELDEVEQVKFVSEQDLVQMINIGEKIEENCVRMIKKIWSEK